VTRLIPIRPQREKPLAFHVHCDIVEYADHVIKEALMRVKNPTSVTEMTLPAAPPHLTLFFTEISFI